MKALIMILTAVILLSCGQYVEDRYEVVSSLDWEEVFHDDFSSWDAASWHLDGMVGKADVSEDGLVLTSGGSIGSDSSHVVLWNRKFYRGDIRVEYDFTRLDTTDVETVAIIYLCATGSQENGVGYDIMSWNDKRRIPAMKTYFNNMDLYHISYAVEKGDTLETDYVRGRRYMPQSGRGLAGTALSDEYFDTGLFETGKKHHVVVTKYGEELFMEVMTEGARRLFHFDLSSHPLLDEGYIGLRQMWGRQSLYSDFRVSQIKDDAVVTDSEVIGSLSLSDSHPRLVMSREDIAVMKSNVASGEEPYAGAWERLEERVDRYLESGRKIRPYTGDDSYLFYKAAIRDGEYARDLSIAYHITGNKDYAAKATDIIAAWCDPANGAGAYFDHEIRYANTGMVVARSSFVFMYAYDLLMADSLIPEAVGENFRNWLRTLLPHIREGARRWEENDYFGQQYYQNHIAADALGQLAMGVMLGDENLVKYALCSEENPRDVLDVIKGCILMKGETPNIGEPVDIPVEDGEIIDRYRHFILGGHYKDYKTKPNRALQYCGLTTTLMVCMAEIMRHNGVDLYSYEAQSGEAIVLPLKYYADFYIQKNTVIKSGFYSGENDWINKNEQATFALWEVASCRYPQVEIFRDVLDVNDRTSANLHLLGPVSLTHGRKLQK